MSDSKQMTTTPSENGAGSVAVPKTKRRTCMRHCKRFWWVYLIVFLCIVVLVVCLVIFVGVPKIAQSKMNEAELDIQGVNVLSTQSDSYVMEINSTITTDGSIKAQVDAFEGELYLEDHDPHTPFATLPFPRTSANKHQTVNISEPVDILDHDAFTRFNVWFHNNETLRVTIKGRTKVKPSGLSRKYGVDFKKTVTLNGLNIFDGTEVTDGHISTEEDDNGKNFNGTAKIPNASVFTLDIGNASFISYINDTEVGSLYIDNLVLQPGDNDVNITANMNQIRVISFANQKPYCDSGIIPFKLLGENVTNHGQNISYFAAALASANQTVEINIGEIIKNDLGAKVGCRD